MRIDDRNALDAARARKCRGQRIEIDRPVGLRDRMLDHLAEGIRARAHPFGEVAAIDMKNEDHAQRAHAQTDQHEQRHDLRANGHEMPGGEATREACGARLQRGESLRPPGRIRRVAPNVQFDIVL